MSDDRNAAFLNCKERHLSCRDSRGPNQFSCNVEMTFMPELWPGMLLAIDELQFQCYIHSVTHSWNLQDGSGFQTSVNVMAPSTTGSGATGAASANSTGGLLGLARSGPTVS